MYRMMIVDDEHMIHLSLRKLVESSGLQITIAAEAEDGAEALQLLEETRPDIVVTDIRMPELDGLSFIEAALERKKGTRFIILSGYNNFEYARQAIKFGVADFLLKPVDPDQFLQALQQLYNELQQRDSRFSRHNEWMVSLQAIVKELAASIWAANATEASALAAQACQLYKTSRPDELSFAQFTHNVAGLIAQELQERNFTLAAHPYRDYSSWPNHEEECVQALNAFIVRAAEEVRGTRNLGSRANILKAVRYLEEHYAEEELSLTDVAQSLGMSDAYFSRSFKEEMNINFVKYLIRLRMDKAKELLTASSSPTAEVAYRVGFSDYPHFSKTFKKHFGLTPSEYRKQLGSS
ncbi:helix-turn-helix domain-containing protein [Paenibacillus sp. GCM10027626]|uniref:response regulator transcription factor n=1 Tax=Paenibacillus sp. GCM10027626 TaxID=3273411 RepID=UPI00363013C0